MKARVERGNETRNFKAEDGGGREDINRTAVK
jgi:hypothetical protein